MNKTVTEEAKEIIANATAENAKQLEVINQQLCFIEEQEKAAEADKAAADKALNAEAFLKASRALDELKVTRGMYEHRRDEIKTAMNINPEEYKRLKTGTISEYTEEVKAAEKQLFTLSNRMKAISDQLEKDRAEANAILSGLRALNPGDTGVKEIKYQEAEFWGNAGCNAPQYKAFKRENA